MASNIMEIMSDTSMMVTLIANTSAPYMAYASLLAVSTIMKCPFAMRAPILRQQF